MKWLLHGFVRGVVLGHVSEIISSRATLQNLLQPAELHYCCLKGDCQCHMMMKVCEEFPISAALEKTLAAFKANIFLTAFENWSNLCLCVCGLYV